MYKCIGNKCFDDENNKIYDGHSGEIYEKDFSDLCNTDIIPTVIPAKRRIIAIGDIHGDINKAIKCLIVGHLIKEVNIMEYITIRPNIEIKEYTQKLIIIGPTNINFTNYEINKISYNDIADNIKNQVDIVYRYYKIGEEYFIKVIKPDTISWFKWIGGDTYVVQVGDQIDRCRSLFEYGCMETNATIDDEDSDIEIMLLFDSIDKIAKKNGGRVFSLLGNHEIMNVKGDMRYVSYKGIMGFSNNHNVHNGLKNRSRIFKTIIAKKMACTRTTVLVIGDYLFVHGGIAIDLAYNYKLLNMNSVIRKYLYGIQKNNNDIRKLLESSKLSPLWYRKLAYIPEDNNKACKNIFDPIINTLNTQNNYNISTEPIINIQGMVIGHTPNFTISNKGITTSCNNKLLKVDVGTSSAFDNFTNKDQESINARVPQVIEILTNLRTKEQTINILK